MKVHIFFFCSFLTSSISSGHESITFRFSFDDVHGILRNTIAELLLVPCPVLQTNGNESGNKKERR